MRSVELNPTRNRIVNATTVPPGGPQWEQENSMSPQKTNNKNGGSLGRAASGTASRCDAARAENLRVLAPSFAVIACAVTTLAFSAPDLWPQLFVR